MATMYPEFFPAPPDPESPEYICFQQLKTLPDHYSVFYSKRLNAGPYGRVETEIDFLIFNNHDVLICLEVKGGLIAYDGRQDRWTQNGEFLTLSPDRQATRTAHRLTGVIPQELRNVNVDWALCFPQCSFEKGDDSLTIPRTRFLDAEQARRFQSEITLLEKNIRLAFGRRGATKLEAEAIIRRLTRNVTFVDKVGVRLARDSNQFIQVTTEQFEVLGDLEINPRMIVHGPAGTGKTVLAQEFAKRLAFSGHTVLLLFYNKGIARKVRFAFSMDSAVTVSTFSSFAKRLVLASDSTWWNSATEKDNDFWTTILPARLFDIPQKQLPIYDSIIVDEGQDFKPEWYEFLLSLLRPGKTSRFCVFLDEHQDLFGHWKHFHCTPEPARKILTKNCRNTKSIVGFINRAYPTKMEPFSLSPTGAPINQRWASNDAEELKALEDDIATLVGQERVRPGSIVIILNTNKDESLLANTRALARYPLESTYNDYDPNAQKLYYTQIDHFKGLEADIVFLLLGPDFPQEAVPKAIYVRGSRAKHLLYVYRRL